MCHSKTQQRAKSPLSPTKRGPYIPVRSGVFNMCAKPCSAVGHNAGVLHQRHRYMQCACSALDRNARATQRRWMKSKRASCSAMLSRTHVCKFSRAHINSANGVVDNNATTFHHQNQQNCNTRKRDPRHAGIADLLVLVVRGVVKHSVQRCYLVDLVPHLRLPQRRRIGFHKNTCVVTSGYFSSYCNGSYEPYQRNRALDGSSTCHFRAGDHRRCASLASNPKHTGCARMAVSSDK